MHRQEQRKWVRLVALANADPSNQAELANAAGNCLVAFGFPPRFKGQLIPVPRHPRLALEARKVLPQIRTLLAWFAGERNLAKKSAEFLAQHANCLRVSEEIEPRIVPGPYSDRKTIERQILVNGRTAKETIIQGTSHVVMEKARRQEFPHFADPVCFFVKEFYERDSSGVPPIRVCANPSCAKFFIRHGRSRFCSMSCKYAKHGKEKSAAQKRDYQIAFLMRKRLTEDGPRAFSLYVEKLKRRKMLGRRRNHLLEIARRVQG